MTWSGYTRHFEKDENVELRLLTTVNRSIILQFYTWNQIWLFLCDHKVLITGDQNYGSHLFEEKFLLRPEISLQNHDWFCRHKINQPIQVNVPKITQRNMTNILRMAVSACPIFVWYNAAERFPVDWRPVLEKASMTLKRNSAPVRHRLWRQPTIPYYAAIWTSEGTQ